MKLHLLILTIALAIKVSAQNYSPPATGNSYYSKNGNCKLGDDRFIVPVKRVSTKNGKFFSGDKEFRIWGFNSSGINMRNDQYEHVADRLSFIGVNLIRLHSISQQHYNIRKGYGSDKDESMGLLPLANFHTTRKIVNIDKFFMLLNSLRKKNIFVALVFGHGRLLKPSDSGILRTTEPDRLQWEKAVSEIRPRFKRNAKTIFKFLFEFDARAMALHKEFSADILNLKNPESGIMIKDDPQIAFIETVNEMHSGGILTNQKILSKIPIYFKNKIVKKWNKFLQSKYQNNKALATAWNSYGKTCLQAHENLSKKNIVLEFDNKLKHGSDSPRIRDLYEFCAQMDLKSQLEMKKHYRETGYKGLCIYSAFWNKVGNTLHFWNNEIQPYWEDHFYGKAHNLFRSVDLICAKRKVPYVVDRPYWRSETRNSNGSCSIIHWSRIAYPLYYAVYNALTGRDGTTFHAWVFHPINKYDFSKTQKNRGYRIQNDIPWQLAFRAAGRLFRSGEINRVKSLSEIKKISRAADVLTRQVYRSAKQGILKVETPNFVALAVDHPYECKFKKLKINITSDKCNVVVIEKISDKIYEITAMGMAGGTFDRKISQHNYFKPTTYVTGTVDFNHQEIKDVHAFDYKGKCIGVIQQGGKKLHMKNGYNLYRVVVE